MRALRLTPAVVALLLVRTGWHLLADADARVADGVLVFARDDWFITIVLALGWTITTLTGIALLDGGPRPVRRAIRALPVALLGVAAYVAPLIICGFLAGTLLPGEPMVVVLVVTLVAIILIGVATNFALSATVAVVEQAGFAAFTTYAELRGKRWDMGVLFAFGVVAPVVALGLPDRYLHAASTPTGLAVDLLLTLVAATAVVLPSITLLEIYRRTRPIPELAPRSTVRPGRVALVGAAMLLLLPTAVTGAIVSSHLLTQVHHEHRTGGSVLAVGWPPTHHPVLVTTIGIEDCLDDRCSATRLTRLPWIMSTASATVRRDGTVAVLSDGLLTVCDPARHCVGGQSAGRVELLRDASAAAVIANDEGEIVLAQATPSAGATISLRLLRCRDESCRTATIVELGRFPSAAISGDDVVSAGVDRHGRLFVVYRDVAKHGWLGWCVRPDCAQTKLIPQGQTDEDAPAIEDLVRAPRVPGVPLCSFSSCRGLTPAVVAARPEGGFYAVVTEPAGSDQVDVRLVRCPDPSCASYLHVATLLRDFRASWTGDPLMFGVSDPGRQDERWTITVHPSGRVLLTKPHETPSVIITVEPV
ncbi:MAG: hypothetical protein HOU81_17300 [Hamadaea sp.]|uniref:hypothetical protein n=1 Tax=Hamadaea sp. TaxID=2024425 RepID=UPI001832ECCB|nr:hypothetical protein [Hamadaea sp.]NUR72576.1 hypothetical protein [Hamadaea sp.]NUT22215.1 hypothetical protein [Hamadaea sp.]